MTTVTDIHPGQVHRILERHGPVDGYTFVLDLERSSGSWIVDARTGERYLDLFTFFSSAPLGINPPVLVDDPGFMARLARAAANKPSNPDAYSVEYAQFVTTFSRVLGDPALPYLFFIDGGALAVENALKAAFDWKAQRVGDDAWSDQPDLAVLHLERAFHGRSGYTMSLTNTEPAKIARYPKFGWPRIPVPAIRFPVDAHAGANGAAERRALAAARDAFEAGGGRIACFIAEPIQGEGGDNHLSAAFLQAMQAMCREYDALFVLDEIQTGCGATGTAWAYQQFGLEPDLVAFGKKTQVCGVMAGRRIDEVPGNVFRVPSRISSTWGGSLADMVRITRVLEVIEQDHLFASAAQQGNSLRRGLVALAAKHPRLLNNARGRGLICAIDASSRHIRDELLHRLYRDEHVIALPCGELTLRLRPNLAITADQVDIAITAIDRCACAISVAATPRRSVGS
jgi:L-lysine 6-transaminase